MRIIRIGGNKKGIIRIGENKKGIIIIGGISKPRINNMWK